MPKKSQKNPTHCCRCRVIDWTALKPFSIPAAGMDFFALNRFKQEMLLSQEHLFSSGSLQEGPGLEPYSMDHRSTPCLDMTFSQNPIVLQPSHFASLF